MKNEEIARVVWNDCFDAENGSKRDKRRGASAKSSTLACKGRFIILCGERIMTSKKHLYSYIATIVDFRSASEIQRK